MAGINIELPAFAPDDLNDPRARRRIVSYLYRLAEQVKYLSTHIDGENMTDDFQQEMISTASARLRNSKRRSSRTRARSAPRPARRK